MRVMVVVMGGGGSRVIPHNDTPRNPPALSVVTILSSWIRNPPEELCDEALGIILRDQIKFKSVPFDVQSGIWLGPLMNATSCHLLMELSCL